MNYVLSPQHVYVNPTGMASEGGAFGRSSGHESRGLMMESVRRHVGQLFPLSALDHVRIEKVAKAEGK